MDPYLEAPDIWPDFHDALAAAIRIELNQTLPPPYYARLEMRPEIGIVGLDEPRRVVPDVAIVRPHRPEVAAGETGLAVLDRARTDVSASIHMRIPNEPLRHHFVAFNQAYDGGPYARGAVDYNSPPDPPIDSKLAGWVTDRLGRWRS